MQTLDHFNGVWFTKWDEEQQLRIVNQNEINWYIWDPHEEEYNPAGDASVYERAFWKPRVQPSPLAA